LVTAAATAIIFPVALDDAIAIAVAVAVSIAVAAAITVTVTVIIVIAIAVDVPFAVLIPVAEHSLTH
jgi:hypothetical protein